MYEITSVLRKKLYIERAEDFCFDNKEAISKSVKSLVIVTIGNFLKPVKTYLGLNLKEGD